MAKKKTSTTIIFVSNNQHSNKPIQVPSAYITHWKKYVAVIIAFFLILISSILYLSYSKGTLEYSIDQLSQELAQKEKAFNIIDTTALKKHYTSIDQKLAKINRYLKARGVKPILAKNEGGLANKDILSAEETASFYESYLDKMAYLIAFTPMGLPHSGGISSSFGHRENPFTGENIETHKGLDIKGKYGGIVKSAATGKVIFAARRGGYGNCIVIKHGNGFETIYGHLSKILVKEGQIVQAGQQIGKIGSTGRSTGPHLHYEIHKNGKPINPKSFLTTE